MAFNKFSDKHFNINHPFSPPNHGIPSKAFLPGQISKGECPKGFRKNKQGQCVPKKGKKRR